MAKKPADKKKVVKGAVQGTTQQLADVGGDVFSFFSSPRAVAISRPSSLGSAVVGIELTQFAPRYLFGNNVYRLGVFAELVGEPAAGKTALQLEIERWHIYGSSARFAYAPSAFKPGAAKHICAEPRFSPDLAESIIGVPASGSQCFIVADGIKCVEDWQEETTNWVKLYEEHAEAGIAPLFASCVGEDSLTSVTTRDEAQKTWDAGSANPGFAQIAKSLNLYFKVLPGRLAFWPVSFVATNHQKVSKDTRGFNVRREPGGSAVTFGGTTIIRVENKGKSETQHNGVRLVKLTYQKNSLSSAGEERSIEVEMRWHYDPTHATPANPRGQCTVWDWEAATVALLTSFEPSSAKRKRIDEIVYIENVNKSTKTADCKQYGLKKAHWHTIGDAIAQDKVTTHALDELFNVTHRAVYIPGIDYRIQQQQAIAQGSTLVEGQASAVEEAAQAEETISE